MILLRQLRILDLTERCYLFFNGNERDQGNVDQAGIQGSADLFRMHVLRWREIS